MITVWCFEKIHEKLLEEVNFSSPFIVMKMKTIFLSFPIKPEKLKKTLFNNLETLEAKMMKIHAKFTTRGSLNEIQKEKSIKKISKIKFVKK